MPGFPFSGAVEELPLSEFRKAMETNYFGVLRCIQAVVPGMRERRSGYIINVSSVGGRLAGPGAAPYTASKWALEAMSEALAAEVKRFGIRVSIVEPGVIDTPIFDKMRKIPANTRYPGERRMQILYRASLKHPVPPSLVADKMVEIVGSDTWKLRHPVGPDAAPYLQYRAAKSDEDWVDMLSVENDGEWAATIKREFGLDVDLG